MRIISKLFVFVLVVGLLSSCVSKKKYDELTAAKEATDQALAETQMQVKSLSEEKDALAADLQSTKTDLNGKISDLDAKLNDATSKMGQMTEKLNMTQAELDKLKAQINGMFAAYTNSGLSLEDKDGRLYVVTNSPVNYGSSSARLNKDQRDAIDALAETLKANPAVKIVIEGHTDSQKFKADTGSDNWNLSIQRANSVARRLLNKGVAASQISVAGRADGVPVGDNATSEGRAANRRTVVLPNPDLGGLKGN
ncbi:MAG: OmpA family protein [Saprospiraceae bacterium]|nr:OmpA family protein [Saprospiraceae bacterium]MCB9324779.1 OmpA family protein [Lewinellaceae bacterium]